MHTLRQCAVWSLRGDGECEWRGPRVDLKLLQLRHHDARKGCVAKIVCLPISRLLTLLLRTSRNLQHIDPSPQPLSLMAMIPFLVIAFVESKEAIISKNLD